MLKTADGTGPPTPIDNAVYEWDDNAVVEITSDSYNSNGGTICPQLGNNIFTALGYKTVFVNKASSGSSYSPSLDDNNWTLAGDLYTDAITEIDECLVAVGVDRPAYIIWNLGVNDSSDPSDINDVETDLKSLFERVTTKYPNTPILVCQNGNFLTTSYQTATQRQALIRKWHKEMVELYPNAHFVDINAAYYGVSGMQISNTAHHTQAGLNMKADKILRWLQHDSYTKWARSIIASQFVELTTPQKDAIQDFVNTEAYDALDIFLPFKNQPDRSCIFLDWEFLAAPYDAAGNVGFDEDLGITTDRDNTYYYRTNYNPSWHTMNASATDFWYGLKVGDNSTAAGTLATVMGGVGAYFQQTAASLISYRCNDGTNTTTNVNTSFQDATFYAAGRSGTTKYLWINDAQAASATVTNTGLASTLMYVGARNTGSSSAEWVTANIEYVFAGSQDIDKDQARQDMEAVIDGFAVLEYTPVPDPPTFSDPVTITQAGSGTGIQSGDLSGKTDILVGSDYIFMQFNGLSGTYRMKSENWENVADWATIGSASPQDYAFGVAVADPTYSLYNLKFIDTDNMIKLPGADPTRDFTYQNLILDGGAFAGFLINENVADQDYGNFTWTNVRVKNVGGESWYTGKTGGNSLAYYRGITEVTDCYSENSGREALQFNGHTDVRVTGFLAYNGGLDTGAGIGQNNCIQVQDVYTGYVKKSIFWNFPAFAMLATDDFLFEDCFFYITDDDRTCFLQSMLPNDYTEMVHTGGTLTFRRCTFYAPNYTGNVFFTMQGGTRNYVWEDCIFPASVDDPGEGNNDVDEICDDQRADKVTYSVTITGSTYTNSPNIPQFCDEPGYEGYGKVVCDEYYYNLGYGPRNPNR